MHIHSERAMERRVCPSPQPRLVKVIYDLVCVIVTRPVLGQKIDRPPAYHVKRHNPEPPKDVARETSRPFRIGRRLRRLSWLVHIRSLVMHLHPKSCNAYVRESRLRVEMSWASIILMTRKQIESAVVSGIPFTLLMADGKEYPVPHADHISLPPNASYVIVYDDNDGFTVLPLLTMTGLESKLAASASKPK
jgi:hypothetical protein